MEMLLKIWIRLSTLRDDERGFVTAEHLGVAALAVVAIAAIFVAVEALGIDITEDIKRRLTSDGGASGGSSTP
jgi:hypothetical protein